MAPDLLAWSVAWEQAAFGPCGFYRHREPRDHFATDVSDGTAVADRLADVLAPVLASLVSASASVTVTDVGAADGRLLRQLAERLDPSLATRLHWHAVDLRGRPEDLPPWIRWTRADARCVDEWARPAPGILIAHELLDDIPCDVIEIDDDGRRRLVLVERGTGIEVLGPVTTDVDACAEYGVDGREIDSWCDRWWPRRTPAARVEVGRARDDAWQALAGLVTDGLAIAVDYGHLKEERDEGLWDGGTLTGFRDGRAVSVTTDGDVNLTAHVAMDSCAAAIPRAVSRLERSAEGLWWLTSRMGR